MDIAGLVKGASKGEGLGNRFLAPKSFLSTASEKPRQCLPDSFTRRVAMYTFLPDMRRLYRRRHRLKMSNATCFEGSHSLNLHACLNAFSASTPSLESVKPFRAVFLFGVIDVFSVIRLCQNDYAVLCGAFLLCPVPGVLKPVPRAYPVAVF